MKVTTNPPKGMKNILPYEKSIKEFCIKEIKKVYIQYGYNMIETPIMENICKDFKYELLEYKNIFNIKNNDIMYYK